MKRRVLAVFLAVVMAIGLAACGGSSGASSQTDTKGTESQKTEESSDAGNKESSASGKEESGDAGKEVPEVSTIHWGRANSGNILVTIAKQRGYFDEVGIEVIEDPVESASAALTRAPCPPGEVRLSIKIGGD